MHLSTAQKRLYLTFVKSRSFPYGAIITLGVIWGKSFVMLWLFAIPISLF
jgi:hypothetical protein